MDPRWFAVTLVVPSSLGDALCNFLFECGASGLQTDGDKTQASISAYFEAFPPIAAIRRFLIDLGMPAGKADEDYLSVEEVAEQDWAENWKQHFTPQVIGRHLFVCPPWHDSRPSDRITVVIEPGMAFGTGLHPTTRGCLELMEEVVEAGPIDRALDLGTGSGILAIALAKLGVRYVLAVDTDPVACEVAASNAARNDVADRICIAERLPGASPPFGLIVANLFTNALIETAPRLLAVLAPEGSIVCAGFTASDEVPIRTAYQQLGLSLLTRREEASWVTLRFCRAPHR